MGLGFSEQEEMLRKTARRFLEKECPKSLVRESEEREEGYSPELWKKMAGLGWLGLIFPENYGGAESNFLELILLLEEMGRALVPGPFIPTLVCSGLPILHYGTEMQKERFLPGIADGSLILTPAFIEPTVPMPEAKAQQQVSMENGNYVLSGTKLFVPYAHLADWLLYKAKTDDGITLFLVPAKSPGVNCEILDTMASDKQCELVLDRVRVPGANILGEKDKGQEIVDKIEEWGALAQSAFILGGLEAVLEMSVAYAKERVQFERQIGTFQIIQHQCADMITDIDGVKLLVYEAAWKLSENLPATKEISMAKARASDASRRVCLLGHKIHGGIGLIVDHDMQLYFRRAKAAEIAFGDAEFHREVIAQQMGL